MARTTRGSSPRDNHENGSRSRRDSYRDDRGRKRSKRHYDDDIPEFMAAGFSTSRNDQDRGDRRSEDRRDSRDDRRDSRVDRRDSRDRGQRSDSYKRKDWRKTRAQSERSFEEKMDADCRFHLYKGDDGKLRSNHSMRNCREFDQMATDYINLRKAAATPAPVAAPQPANVLVLMPPPPPQPAAGGNSRVPYSTYLGWTNHSTLRPKGRCT